MPKIHTVNAINVGDSADKMIPPTPTTLTTMPASKAKIGFSIDSIVGSDDVNRSSKDYMKSHDFKYVNDYQTEIARALRLSDSLNTDLHKFRPEISKDVSSPQQITAGMFEYPMKRESSISPPSSYGQPTLPLPSVDEHRKSPRTPSPHRTTSVGPEPIPLQFMNGIHSANGPIRPMPIVPPPNLVDAKAMPPYLGMPPTAAPHPNAHLLQAQFQMAAALAQRQAVEQSFAPGGPFRHTPPPPHMVNPAAMGRESYQLYPWLLSRHGRIFPHGFPGNFLLHPFRKPKRVRTAFSPGQLLKLEHAFESNQYVVGAERKQLAQALNLSETQVKVWFQNRRTKHKRMQQEDDKGEGGKDTNDSRHSYEDEDEMIDMEMDDYPSDDERH